MATTQITPDNNVVLAEIFIAAPPDRVFQALTDPAQMSQWWGQKEMYRVTVNTSVASRRQVVERRRQRRR